MITTNCSGGGLAMKLNRIIEVIGVSGAGKSFLLSRLKENGVDGIEIVSFGRLMRLANQELTRNRNLSSLSNEDLAFLIDYAIDYAVKHQPIVLDTRLIYQQQGLIQVNYDSVQRLRTNGYIHVSARPEVILERRLSDIKTGKKVVDRSLDSVEYIAFEQEMSLTVASAVANITGASLKILENNTLEDSRKNVDSLGCYILEVLNVK